MEELTKLIEKWQLILKLGHWHISYEFCDRYKMEGDFQARVEFALDKFSAAILFIEEEAFSKFQKNDIIKELYDLEETVVHELMHIVLAPMECEGNKSEEQTVNILTRILLEQHKK